MSQLELSSSTGYSSQLISQVASGKLRDVSGDGVTRKIAAALGVDHLWLWKGLGDPPWALTTPIINQGYYTLIRQIRQKLAFKISVGVHVDLPARVVASDALSLSWKPEVEDLFRVADAVGVEVDRDAVRRDYWRTVPPEVNETIKQALQMALVTYAEQEREKIRAALSWVEKAISE